MKHFLLLVTVVLSYAFGIYFYCRGFLLTRNAILMNSTCTEVQAEKTDACWMEAKFNKAIFVVVDALRYDFLLRRAPDDGAGRISPFYNNKFTNVNAALENKPKNCLLFKFVADPPTTTMQRLKALTTGSLPTFIDAGSNFGGAAIEEDNIIDQLVRGNQRIMFMGDDTWLSLFPQQFHTQFAYPSFDVKDLHTVDNGVTEHLMPALNRTEEWDVLIAHFLGVDHCGHKFGPNHPEMAAKLTQIDNILQTVMTSMNKDTVLFVLGDHGMTQTGDHGGDSDDETGAGLFIYSPTKLHNEKHNIREAIVQVDLVPTLSMLLDLPIPFSNLGAIIPELFPDDGDRLQAARANVWQVVRYTENYLANFRDSLLDDRFHPILKIFYSLEPEELTVVKCLEIVRQIARVFVECWAKFHLGWMVLGILTLCETLLWSLSLLFDRKRSLTGRKIFLKVFVMVLCILVVLARYETIPPIVGVILTAQVVLHLHTACATMITLIPSTGFSFGQLLPFFLLVFHAVSQFSNSFVVFDDQVSQFITKSLFVLLYWNNFLLKPTKELEPASHKVVEPHLTIRRKKTVSFLGRFNLKALAYLSIALLALRLATVFNRCREEQTPCEVSLFMMPFASLFDDSEKALRISLALASLLTLFLLPRFFMKSNGHFSGESAYSLTCQLGAALACAATAVHWFVQWTPEKYMRNVGAGISPAWLVFAALLFTFVTYNWNPLLAYGYFLDSQRDNFVSTVDAYRHIKDNWRTYFQKEKQEANLLVFGAHSAFSGSFAGLLWLLTIFALLLLGDGLAFSLLCFALVIVAALEVGAYESSTMTTIFLLSEISCHFFYAFGHHATFSSIPWDAAFVGVPGNFGNQLVQATLVIMHIGMSCILTSFVVPFVVVWHLFKSKLGGFKLEPHTHESDAKVQTEMNLVSDKEAFLTTVAYCDLIYLSSLALKLIAVVAASAVHRRHLMVWKIFAPKFIFEGILFLVSCCCVLLQYSLVVRFSQVLTKFLRKFTVKSQ